MKGLLLVLFSAVLVLQLASAFPRFRVHREAQSQVDMDLSVKADILRTELYEYIFFMLVGLLKHCIESHKNLFENVLKYADESELKSDALKEQLAKFADLVGQANSLPEEETFETLEKLFNLFGECTELVSKYDELESPTEEEKLIKRIFDENGGSGNILEFVGNFIQLRSSYKAHIQEYFDLISDDDKVKDGKFLEWFKKFKTTTDFDESVVHQNPEKFFECLQKFRKTADFDKSVDGTMEVFEFYRDDDYIKKK